MISSGTSPLLRWTCSARGATTSSANERNVSWTISKSSSRCGAPAVSASDGEEVGVAEPFEERAPCSGAASTPHAVLASDEPGHQVVHHVGDEHAREPGLDVALGAVVEHRPGGRDRRRGVGEVVGDDLMDVGATGGGQPADAGADDADASSRRRSPRTGRVQPGASTVSVMPGDATEPGRIGFRVGIVVRKSVSDPSSERGVGQWRAALRPPQEPLRGRASTAPVWLWRRNIRPRGPTAGGP